MVTMTPDQIARIIRWHVSTRPPGEASPVLLGVDEAVAEILALPSPVSGDVSGLEALNKIAAYANAMAGRYHDDLRCLAIVCHVQEAATALERLSSELDRWKVSFDGHVYVTNDEYGLLCAAAGNANLLTELKRDQIAAHARAETSQVALGVARTALEPFADFTVRPNALNDPRLPDDTVLEVRLWNVESTRDRRSIGPRLGDFRRAAQALQQIGGGE